MMVSGLPFVCLLIGFLQRVCLHSQCHSHSRSPSYDNASSRRSAMPSATATDSSTIDTAPAPAPAPATTCSLEQHHQHHPGSESSIQQTANSLSFRDDFSASSSERGELSDSNPNIILCASKSLPELGADCSNNVILNEERKKELQTNGFIILDDFISKSTVRSLVADIQNLRQNHARFRKARVGDDSKTDPRVRVAEHCFLHQNRQSDVPNAARDAALKRLDQLRNELSRRDCLHDYSATAQANAHAHAVMDQDDDKSSASFIPLEPELDDLLYVYYPHGGFYARHTDAAPGSPSVLRKYSVLLYLNDQEWTHDMGGQLRMYQPNNTNDNNDNNNLDKTNNCNNDNESIVDVLPLGGRLVLFASDRIPHEVLPTNQPRMVMVGWFNRAPTEEEMNSFLGSQ